jgi:UDP-2-acetamido-3-amino-2,3-dideoxy-glucuronate N-acetyltransferase
MNTSNSKIFIHPKAEVNSTFIGENTTIWQFVIILPNARIGKNCNINCNVFIENEVMIGDNVTIKPGVQLWDGIKIEDGVFIGPNVTFTNDLFPRSKNHDKKFAEIIINKGASLGANATILGGIIIGEYSMIGAGSVVTRDVPPHTLYFGSPAKFKGYVCFCGDKLDHNLKCVKCGKSFVIIDDVLKEKGLSIEFHI